MQDEETEIGGAEVAVAEAPQLADGVGAKLRALRRARGLTLAHVADATGISKSFLSLVETGRSDITVGRLMRLVEFFGVAVGDLLPDVGDPTSVAVVRSGQWKLLTSPSEGICDYLLAPDATGEILPFVGVFDRGGRNEDFAEHEGHEFAFVLEGSFTLEIRGADPIVLATGDSVSFDGRLPHAYTNTARGESRLLCVVTQPKT